MRPIYLFSISTHPDAININSLDITFLQPKIDFSSYDFLILTSKQASKALQHYDLQEYIHLPALAISKESAKSYEAIGGTILNVGDGYGDTLSDKIKQYAKTKRWLYLRAEIVASDFVARCREEGYLIDEAIVYRSACSEAIKKALIAKDAILIFTSPSSLKCFLKNHSFSQENKIIVIGKTTAQALPQGIDFFMSEKRTVQSCVALAKTLF